jgi:HD-like signal output (HDOD) protein
VGIGETATAKKRLLFVDDEAAILSSLQNVLRRERDHWDMVFAHGSENALGELRAQPFDVVVTDMRMPGMDGAMLLTHIQEHYPATIRILLSGQAERESVVRALPATHQFLAKPCSASAIRAAIARSLSMSVRPGDGTVRALIGRLDKLPSPPQLYFRLADLAASPVSTLTQVAAVVNGDPAMAAKVLQLANSAAFGLPRTTTSIPQAVSYLGIDTLKCIALTSSMFASGSKAIETLQTTALEVAGLAKRLMPDRARADEAFVAGLLHDIGRVVLAVSVPETFALLTREADASGERIDEVERRILGASHAEIGACLLGIWGLPPTIVAAVACHHEPAPGSDPMLIAAVHAAQAMIAGLPVDEAMVAAAGGELAAWQAIAEAA